MPVQLNLHAFKRSVIKLHQKTWPFAGGMRSTVCPALTPYLVVVGGDEPQLQVQVVVPLLHADKVEDVVVFHAAHAVDLILVLPRQLVLHEERRERENTCRCCFSPN